jgi:hypothetical protein
MKTMKMTLLHMQFVLIFVTAESQAELGRTWQNSCQAVVDTLPYHG